MLETDPHHRTRRTLRDEEPVVRRRALALTKSAVRSMFRAPYHDRRIVLIFGCQRSGTTMIQQTVLDRSWHVLILEEHDRRLVGRNGVPEETAWEDYATVLARLRHIPFEVVVAKPLVESSQARELLDVAESAKGIWMLRRYDTVAQSNVERFGPHNPYRDLRPFCEHDQQDWRSRAATRETCDTVQSLVGEGLAPLDAAALFWWARNRLYFDQHLWADERIRVLRYERACNKPEDAVAALSDYVGITLPVNSIASRLRPQPEDMHVTTLHPAVERLCRETWESFSGCPEF